MVVAKASYYIPQMHLAREFDPMEQVLSFSETPKLKTKKFKQHSRRHPTSQRTAVHLQYSLQQLETFCNLILAILASYICCSPSSRNVEMRCQALKMSTKRLI